MRPLRQFHLRSLLEPVSGSIERRLVGALLLILATTVTVQFMSQDRAFELRGDSELLRRATRNADQAEQLVKAVGQFRLATRLTLIQASRRAGARGVDDLTDAAIKVGEAVNSLRLSGMPQIETSDAAAVFADLDRHVGAILAVPPAARGLPPMLEERNERMAVFANAILAEAGGDRELASSRFDRLKLDRTLVCDLGRDPAARAVFEAAVTMALNLGAEVVAEGISEPGLLAPVRDAGCTHVQGFHYSLPLEVPAVAPYFAQPPEPARQVA